MFKSLVKKQLLELNSFYFQDRKTGKRRTKKGIAGFITLYAVLFVFLGVMFGFMAVMLGNSLLASYETSWLYYAMMGLVALLLGTLGSVFNTYSSLYLAKDNELLLSMPITPHMIIGARLIGNFCMSLLYSAVAWIPAVVVAVISGKVTVTGIINSILLIIVIALLVTALTCIFGWLIAVISTRVRSKTFIVVILSLLFFGVYYYFCFRMNSILSMLVQNAVEIGKTIKAWIWPVYQLGLAGAGDMTAMGLFTGFTLILLGLCCYVISISFSKIVSMKPGEKKTEYRNEMVKASGTGQALFRRELKHFTSNATYMLNCGLGIVILPVVAVAAVVKGDTIREFLEMISSEYVWVPEFAAVAAVSAVCMALSMNAVSAPSVSLEGRTLWVIKSLPVSTWQIIEAKERLHIVLNAAPAALTQLVICLVLNLDAYQTAAAVLVCIVYAVFTADLGLVLGLKHPNLDWTSEVVPIKQSAPVMITLFGGWAISLVIAGVYFLLRNTMSHQMYLVIVLAVLILAVRLMRRWLRTEGQVLFEQL